MGCTTPVIRPVTTPAHGRIVIEANDGNRYSADLSSFRIVSCDPPDAEAWARVSIDGDGLLLGWACRFEVHADQVVGLADKVARVEAAA